MTEGKKRPLFGPCSDDNLIKFGDQVILYAGHNNMSLFKVEEGAVLNHRHGKYSADDMVGKALGTMVTPQSVHTTKRKRSARRKDQETLQTGGFVTLLPVMPELWAESLQHRTQITYGLDNSLIVSHLHLKPGSVVIESGTGSGALSSFLARAVGAKGHVYTFEFNESRFLAAREDFKRLGLDQSVTAAHADVYQTGFGEQLNGKADGVFLDLPNPWIAIPHATKALKPFGRICTFSPCIEQVQRSTELMSRLGYSHVKTVTVLLREQRIWRSKAILPESFKAGAQRFRKLTQPDEENGTSGETQETNTKALVKPAQQAVQGSGEYDDEEKDVLALDANGSPVFPEELQFRLQQKFEQVAPRAVTAYDRHPGHTGYLTFAYAPVSEI
mmetsp:Transcript_23886/g.42091  ORF Transcript_23886/g.42091 Transcript_23886/m.42091 type:complete len:387 (-) Transcript_23886:56-1216(-)